MIGPSASPQPGKPETLSLMAEVSIVIPHYGSAALTAACREAIAQNTPEPHEVVVVDNGTGDDVEAAVRNDVNRGFAVACNQGFDAASHDLVLFLNNDTRPGPGWLGPLIAAMGPQVGAASSVATDEDGMAQEWLPAIHQKWDGTLYPMPRDCPGTPPGPVDLVPGFCLMVRREAFDQAGGFDERYWNGLEDVDLMLRMGQNGWLLVHEPRSRVMHHLSAGGEERWSRMKENVALFTSEWAGVIKPDVVHSKPPAYDRARKRMRRRAALTGC